MKYISLIALFLFLACNNDKTKTATLPLNLKTIEDKKNFLEKIFEEDQAVRGSHGSEIMLKHGKKSEEYRAYVQTQLDQDAENLSKIERYFAQYGHPKKSEVGGLAAQTPWAVIHHANTYEERERNFDLLYKAYLNGDIDDGAISMFLGRMYEMKNGKRFYIKSPFKAEDEIKQLREALGLGE